MTDTFHGVAYLAAMHRRFPWRDALKVYKGVNRPALAVLWGTFGANKRALREFMKQNADRPHLLQIYHHSQVCHRKNNCYKGEICRRCSVNSFNRKLENNAVPLRKEVQRRLQRIKTFVDKHSNLNTHINLVSALEDNMSTKAARTLHDWLAIWPCPLVRNPVGHNQSQALAGAGAIEMHGNYPPFPPAKKFIWNMDGVDINFKHRDPTITQSMRPPRIKEHLNSYNGRAEAVFLWSALHQGIDGDSSTSPPPRRRRPRVPMQDVIAMRGWLRGLN